MIDDKLAADRIIRPGLSAAGGQCSPRRLDANGVTSIADLSSWERALQIRRQLSLDFRRW